MRKLSTLLMLLLASFIYSSAWAQDYIISVTPGNGTFYRRGEVNTNNWCERFVSNGTPQVVVNTQKTTANPLGERKFNLSDTSGYSFSCGSNIRWDISVEDGYYITGYKIVGTAKDNILTITPDGGETVTFTTSGQSTVNVSGLWTSSTSYVTNDTQNGDKQIAYTTYEIYVTKKPVKTVEWYTANPFSPNDNASVYYVGITTPGTTSNTYTMTAFSFYENSGYGAASRYTAICKSAPSAATSWKIAESEVLAISNENTTPTAEGYIDYTLNEGIELAGGTTYYMVFLTSNTATDGSYTVGTQRVRLKNNSTYPPTVCLSNGTVRTDLIPGFKATLTTDALYSVNYTCKSTVDGSDITSGTFSDVMGTITAPSLDGYQFSHATTENGDDFDMTQAVTTDLNLYLYYVPLYNVTYNVYMGGNLIKSVQKLSAHGSTPAIPDELSRSYVTYTYDVDEITAATTEVNVTATWNGPFEISTDFDNAKWYNMKVKDEAFATYVPTNTPNVEGDRTLTTRSASNYAIQWAFVGDPITGFTIYNREAGGSLVMGSPASSGGSSSPASMASSGSQVVEKWIIKESSYLTNGFFLTDGTYALNFRKAPNVNFAYWTGGADDGSTFTVLDAENFYEQVASEIIPFFQDPSTVNTNFNISSDGAALMQNKLFEVTANEFCSQADYETLKQQLEDNIVYPETGYFRIKSSGSRGRESYIGYGEFSQWGASYKGLCTRDVSVKETDLSTVILLTKQANKGVYKMSIQGLNVQNRTTNNQCFPLTAAEGADFTFRIYQPGVVAITSDFTDQGHLHEGNFGPSDGGAVVRWTFSSEASHWTVEPADVATLTLNEVDGKSYGTTYLPFNAYFLSGVKAYAVKVDGNNAKFTEVANNEFPAGTGVLLISDKGNTSVSVHPTTSGVAAVTDNDLTGHYLAGNVSDALVLNKNGENVVGFYMLNTYSSLAANRAYLPTSALGTGVRALTLVQGTTGIDAALVNGNASQVYDLQGRRVMNAQKGLYIVNGKKTLVK